jgi:hypothetical protein
MKNALLILLVVVVAVLAFMLLRRNEAEKPLAEDTKVRTRTRHDHHKPPKDVVTEDCARTGHDNKTCVILISYLNEMTQSGKDTAIEVFRNDTIKWVGDGGETIAVQPMPGVDCSDHTQADKPTGDQSLIGTVQGTGSVQFAQVTSNPDNDHYCYKTNIKVTPPQGKPPYTIDPHIFDQGTGP